MVINIVSVTVIYVSKLAHPEAKERGMHADIIWL